MFLEHTFNSAESVFIVFLREKFGNFDEMCEIYTSCSICCSLQNLKFK